MSIAEDLCPDGAPHQWVAVTLDDLDERQRSFPNLDLTGEQRCPRCAAGRVACFPVE